MHKHFPVFMCLIYILGDTVHTKLKQKVTSRSDLPPSIYKNTKLTYLFGVRSVGFSIGLNRKNVLKSLLTVRGLQLIETKIHMVYSSYAMYQVPLATHKYSIFAFAPQERWELRHTLKLY